MATRMIDDTEAQRYAHQETSGAERREFYAMLATMEKANLSRRGLRPPASSKFQKKKNLEKAGRLLI